MKNRIKILLALALTFSLLTSCGVSKSDTNLHEANAQVQEENTDVSESTDDSDDTNDSKNTSASESTDDSDYDPKDYYYYRLKPGKTKKEVLENSTEFTSMTLNVKHSKKNNADFYSLSVNGDTLDIISDSNISTYQTAKCYFAHKYKHDYIITSLEGKNDKRITYAYRFNGSSLEQVFTKEDDVFYDITDYSYLRLTSQTDCFGTWEITDDYYLYGHADNHFDFDIVCGMNRAQYVTNPKPLTLKQNAIFSMDDSCEEPRELKAGEKIYPDCYHLNGFMVFVDKNGKHLGQVRIEEIEENGHKVCYALLSYDEKNKRYCADYYSHNGHEKDQISEADLFEKTYYSHKR